MHSRINKFIEYVTSKLITQKRHFNLAILAFLPDEQLKNLLQKFNPQFELILINAWQALGIDLPFESIHPDIRGNLLLFALIKRHRSNANTLMLMRLISLMNGFNIDYRDAMNGNTALLLAAKEGNTRALAFTLERNAAINETNYSQESALALAIVNEHITIAERLIAAGSNMNITDKYGHHLIELATFHGDVNMVKLLSIFSSQTDINKALLIAARLGDIKKTSHLISHGASFTFTHHQETAFSIACIKAHHAVAAILAREYFKTYRQKRSRLAMFTGSIFGCSRTAKVNAASAMIHVLSLPVAEHHTLIDHLNSHSHLLKPHHRALQQGELGKITMDLLNISVGNLQANRFTLQW